MKHSDHNKFRNLRSKDEFGGDLGHDKDSAPTVDRGPSQGDRIGFTPWQKRPEEQRESDVDRDERRGDLLDPEGQLEALFEDGERTEEKRVESAVRSLTRHLREGHFDRVDELFGVLKDRYFAEAVDAPTITTALLEATNPLLYGGTDINLPTRHKFLREYPLETNPQDLPGEIRAILTAHEPIETGESESRSQLIARLEKRGERYRKEIERAGGPIVTPEQASNRTDLSRSEIINAVRSGELIGSERDDGQLLVPLVQFENREPIEGLSAVFDALDSESFHGRLGFLLRSFEELGGQTVREALLDGEIDEVVKLARSSGRHVGR